MKLIRFRIPLTLSADSLCSSKATHLVDFVGDEVCKQVYNTGGDQLPYYSTLSKEADEIGVGLISS